MASLIICCTLVTSKMKHRSFHDLIWNNLTTLGLKSPDLKEYTTFSGKLLKWVMNATDPAGIIRSSDLTEEDGSVFEFAAKKCSKIRICVGIRCMTNG